MILEGFSSTVVFKDDFRSFSHVHFYVLVNAESLSDRFDENAFQGLPPLVSKREELVAVLHEKIYGKENIIPDSDQYCKNENQDSKRYLRTSVPVDWVEKIVANESLLHVASISSII